MNALKADPRTVDLRSLAPNYYRLSERVLELFEEEEMVDILSNVTTPTLQTSLEASLLTRTDQTFKKRAAEIADHAHNPKGALGDGVEFLQGLDETERQCKWHSFERWISTHKIVFRVAHDGARETRIWAGEAKKR
jgi:GINS complex subunit 3